MGDTEEDRWDNLEKLFAANEKVIEKCRSFDFQGPAENVEGAIDDYRDTVTTIMDCLNALANFSPLVKGRLSLRCSMIQL